MVVRVRDAKDAASWLKKPGSLAEARIGAVIAKNNRHMNCGS